MGKFRARLAVTLVALGACSSWTGAQTASTPKRPPPAVVVERKPQAPQVITVLHRINSLTMLRALVRSGQQVSAFQDFEDVLQMKAVHTNIIAGLALDDGETIAAWLPEAEAELGPMLPRRPQPAPPAKPAAATPHAPPSREASTPFHGRVSTFFESPDVTVIERDGSSHHARYIGLDGITGLSLLQLSEKSLPARPIAVELPIAVGQRMRLYSPEPATERQASTNDSIYVRVGESPAEIVSILRGRTGEISRLKIKGSKLSASNIGAVVVNDSGQTVGIVESVDGGEANVLSPAAIRAAAKRVLTKQASVPRPWLGISGEPVAQTSIERFIRKGWDAQRALSLLETRRGILLNSVAPNSPAAQAELQDGDVIVRINNDDVKTNDDFSMLLAEAATRPVDFTVVRRNAKGTQTIVVELSQQFEPMFGRGWGFLPPQGLFANPLIERGIETVPLRPLEAPLTGRANSLLVIFVEPESAASKAGLIPGDLIEAIDGRPVSALTARKWELMQPTYTLNVSRNKEKIVLTIAKDDN